MSVYALQFYLHIKKNHRILLTTKEIMNNLVTLFNKSDVETLLVLMTKISQNFDTKLAVTFDLLAPEQKNTY